MKIALITGGAQGIGSAICKELASQNYFVIINYFKSKTQVDKLVKEIKEANGYAESYMCDVRNYEDNAKMIDYIIKKYGQIDLLVNNAGISEHKLFQDITMEDYNNMISTNLSSAFMLSQMVVKHMISAQKGKIINISSIWGLCGASMEVHYSVAKAGLIGLTKSLAQELAPSNIQVNCVAPGAINTRMMQCFTQDEITDFCDTIPLGHLGTPEDVASCVGFLASDKANYITGQVLSPNGGIVI